MSTAAPVQRLCYRLAAWACWFVQVQCVRLRVVGQVPKVAGGYQLAVTHLSHLEPVIVGLIEWRHIRWMSRIEFYGNIVGRLVMHAISTFPVDRKGVCVKAIRTAIAEVDAGGVVGVFPEGGVKKGDAAAIRGGRIKRGICLIAQRTGRPVVPVVVLNTQTLLHPRAYFPFRRSIVYIALGEPILTPPDPSDGPSRRADRAAFAEQLEQAYQTLYQRLLAETSLDDGQVP